MKICRSVSNLSGKRLLIVTLSTATCLEIPLEKAVKPALAEVERPIKGCGDLTIAEVILMILPNFLSCIPGNNDLMSIIADKRFDSRASSHWSFSISRKFPGGGPPLLLIKISASGQLEIKLSLPCSLFKSATT